MDIEPNQENLIRRYLLGVASSEEQQQIEDCLSFDGDYVELLLVVEDDLIDDYVREDLFDTDKYLFEKNYLSTSNGRKRLAIARALVRCATEAAVDRHAKGLTRFFLSLLMPPRPVLAAAVMILIIWLSIGLWQIRSVPSNAEKAMVALNKVYSQQRPLEARITGLSYAPFSVQRGPSPQEEINRVELDRARYLLLSQEVPPSAEGLHVLGQYYLIQRECDVAIVQFRKALTFAPNDPRLHADLGAALLAKMERNRSTTTGISYEDLNESLVHLNKALELAPSQLEALFNRALIMQGERLWRRAREDWKRYLEQDSNSQWGGEARRYLQVIEEESRRISQNREELYQNFLNAWQSNDQALALRAFSQSYSFQENHITEKLLNDYFDFKLNGRKDEAEVQMRALLYVAKLTKTKTGDHFTSDVVRFYRQASPSQLAQLAAARQLIKGARQSYQMSKSDLAIEKGEGAKKLFALAGQTSEALLADLLIGLCQYQRGHADKALQVFARLEKVCAERKYQWVRSQAFYGLGAAHRVAGFFSQAIDESLKGGTLAEHLGDQSGAVRSLYQRGELYQNLGKHNEALRLSRQGLDLSGVPLHYSVALYQISSLSLSHLGLVEGAQVYQQEAVQMAEVAKNPYLLSRSYIHLGAIYEKLKKYDEATHNIQLGIAIGRELNRDETGQEFVHYGLLHLARVYREVGKFDEALRTFDQVANFYRRIGGQIYLYSASKGRLLTFIAQGNDQSAQTELNHVIALYEKYRNRIREESNRNSFSDEEQDIYDVAIKFAYQRLKKPELALAFSETCRARSLLDVSSRGWQVITGDEAPELQISRSATLVGLPEIQRRMPDNAQLIEYAVLDDKTLIWVISKTTIKSREVEIPLADLAARVNQYRETISRPAIQNQEWRVSATDLYDILIHPIEPLLDKQKQLCIIPDKVLTLLPFAALISRESGKFLSEEYSLLYAPSANMFLFSTEQAQQKSSVKHERILAIGNPRFDQKKFPLPDLPNAAREARTIAANYGSSVLLTGLQARKSTVLREILRADVVHFSTHYIPDSWSPVLSKMLLASGEGIGQDGVLFMSDIYQLPTLRTRLAVLSACSTGVEGYLQGEGAIGSSRPFMAAGIPLVVASLWPVDSQATSNLMIAFHRARTQAGQTTVEALRTAQLEMQREGDRYQQPYYWAAFIAVGGYSEY